MQATTECQKEMGFPYEFTYRRTPEGQPKVPDLVKRGMKIRTNYHTGGIVSSVVGPYLHKDSDHNNEEYEQYTICYVREQDWTKNHEQHMCWINELVAVDGRILMLFENNDDEVFIVNPELIPTENRKGQFSLF